MATPAAGVGLTATQQQIVDNAIAATARQSGTTVGGNETDAQRQAAFLAYLQNPANNVAGATVAPSGLDFSTGATQNPGFLGGNDASTQQVAAVVDKYYGNNTSYAQGAPGLIAAINNLFTSVAGGYTAPAPVAATPQPQTATPVVGVATGTSSNPSTNPNPAVTGDVNTTTATTATTGQNLATADPNSVLGQLLNALTNGGSTPLGASTGVSLPPSTILPTDSSGGSTTSGSGSGSSTSNTPTSMTDMIVIGVIASLVAAAIWYFAIHHGSLKALEKDVHV
jgi:hypothetical protein